MDRLPRQGVPFRRALVALALSLCAFAAPASAATIQVNTEADPGGAGCAGVPADCSIRRAIGASAVGDTVAIPAGHYVLDPALKALLVGHNNTLKGTGNPVIDGDGKIGVFSIGDNGNTFSPSFPTHVAIDGVTITGGEDEINGGGGIVVYGALTLTNSTVRDNHTRWDGGGIALPGTEGP